MVETRWFRRAGPGIAAIGALAVIASTTTGAPRRHLGSAGRVPGPPGSAPAPIGAWYRLDPVLVGRRLGRPASGRSGTADLDRTLQARPRRRVVRQPGRSAATVLVGTDDGRASTLSLLDLARRVPLAARRHRTTSSGHATLSPDGRSIVETPGRPADPGRPRRVAPAARRRGPRPASCRRSSRTRASARPGAPSSTWSGGRSDRSSSRSCGEVACRVRLLDEASGERRTVADPSLGDTGRARGATARGARRVPRAALPARSSVDLGWRSGRDPRTTTPGRP